MYAAVFIDAIVVKIRDGQVANRPVYAAIGVTLEGERDILGLWAGNAGSGEGAKFWMAVLTDLRNRGVNDVFFVVGTKATAASEATNASGFVTTTPLTVTKPATITATASLTDPASSRSTKRTKRRR